MNADLLKNYHSRNQGTDYGSHDHDANVSVNCVQQAAIEEQDNGEQLEFPDSESRELISEMKIGNLGDSYLMQTNALLNKYCDAFFVTYHGIRV